MRIASGIPSVVFIAACLVAAAGESRAQGYGAPLTMQGLNHTAVSSSASRSMGGTIFSRTGGIANMFYNPAGLASVRSVDVALGGLQQSWNIEQRQAWNPLRYLPTFSLLMEGLIDSIPDPDLSEPPDGGLGPEDSIARAYDSILPNWKRSSSKNIPVQAFAAVPLEAGGVTIVAGIGAVQYANMNYYFQNNNVLSPSIGTQRPYGIALPGIGREVPVEWSQYIQSREGSVYGYGAALSVSPMEHLAVGVSGLSLTGTTDDMESTISRGRLRFGNDNGAYYVSLDSVYSRRSSTGTSSFSGLEFTVSAQYAGEFVTIGLAVKPPTVITRDFESTMQIDTTGTPGVLTASGSDEMTLPWRGTAGISLAVRSNVVIGVDYEIRPYATAEYKSDGGVVSRPWLSGSSLRCGAEFQPVEWLALRAGYSRQAEVFEPEGNALLHDPAEFEVYSAGIGVRIADAVVNVGYEYSSLRYQDLWQTNVNRNTERRSSVIAEALYTLPW